MKRTGVVNVSVLIAPTSQGPSWRSGQGSIALSTGSSSTMKRSSSMRERNVWLSACLKCTEVEGSIVLKIAFPRTSLSTSRNDLSDADGIVSRGAGRGYPRECGSDGMLSYFPLAGRSTLIGSWRS